MAGPRVYHPLLLGIYPPLALYASGVNYLFFETTLSGFAISIGYAVGLFGFFWLIFRETTKAGVITSLLIVFAFFYGHFNNFLAETFIADQLTIAGQLPRKIASYSLRVWGIGSGILLIWLCWRKAIYPNLTRIFNVMAAALLIVPAYNIASHLIEIAGEKQSSTAHHSAGETSQAFQITGPPRDIYYLIFDRYGSPRALFERFGIDNSKFLDDLRKRGFYIATNSVGNYYGTHHSVASSLNMVHLDHLTERMGRNSGNVNPLTEMVQNHKVQQLLKGAGYFYYHLGSTWEVSRTNKNADVNFSGKAPNEFLSVLMQTNAIPIIARKWDIQIHWIESKCFRTNAKLEMLGNISKREEATFTFAHFLLPHPPFVFEANGRCISEKEAEKREWRTAYAEQLAYTNSRILEVVDSLLKSSDTPPIIVIQADEGPYPKRVVDFDLKHKKFAWRTEPTDSEWRQKMGILNALYLPDGGSKSLYPSITPVNTFRIIFNTYFSTAYELLPDRSFGHTDLEHAYDFFDISNRLKLPSQER